VHTCGQCVFWQVEDDNGGSAAPQHVTDEQNVERNAAEQYRLEDLQNLIPTPWRRTVLLADRPHRRTADYQIGTDGREQERDALPSVNVFQVVDDKRKDGDAETGARRGEP